jgi:hypothetical protein
MSHKMSAVFKELLAVVNRIKTPLHSGANTPISRSRAESFARGSSYEMMSPEEHAAEQAEHDAFLMETLLAAGFMDDGQVHRRPTAHPRRAVVPTFNQ